MKISGIYKIQSYIKNHKIYIGSAINIHDRWNKHLLLLKKNKHYNKKLQNHYNKYGISDLHFTILLGCEKEDLVKIEQYFIDSYHPWFNNRLVSNSNLGFKHSKETISKMKVAQQKRRKDNPMSNETKAKISLSNIGKSSPIKGEKVNDIRLINHIKGREKVKKPVLQYDKNGKYIREWKSITDACNSLNVSKSGIYRMLCNERKSAYNSIWKYKQIV
jgi:group I intron endonuclease